MVHLKFQKEWKFEATTILTQGATALPFNLLGMNILQITQAIGANVT